MSKKNILYIKNYSHGQNLEYLEKNFNVNLHTVNSICLIDHDTNQLDKIINNYDIIIIGGGPQHLTSNYIENYPEISNQIQLIKLIMSTNKLLLGICLGCQIIGLACGFEIIPMESPCIGFNYLDTNTLNFNYINKSNDKYLKGLNYSLLEKSFSYHYDCIGSNNNDYSEELVGICFSKTNIPYIIKHKNANIYGFQFHPEATFLCANKVLQNLNELPYNEFEKNEFEKNEFEKNDFEKNEFEKNDFEKNDFLIYLHFFEIFFNL